MEEQAILKLLKIAIQSGTQADANKVAEYLWESDIYHTFIYSLILHRFNGKENLAEEVMADFFTKRIMNTKNLANFPTDSIISFKKCLYTSVHYFCLSCINKQRAYRYRYPQIDEKTPTPSTDMTNNRKDSAIAFIKISSKLLNFNQQAIFWMRIANISHKRMATIHRTTERAMINKFSWIKKVILGVKINRPVVHRDKSKIMKFLDAIDHKVVRSFVHDLIFSRKGLTEITTELENNGEKSHTIILRSIVYYKRYLHEAA